MLTLAADAWDDTPTLRCAPVVLGESPEAPQLTFGNFPSMPTLGEVVELMERSGAKGLNLGKWG